MKPARKDKPLVTRSLLIAGLSDLGLGSRSGSCLMVHTSMSALGWVVGGAQTIVETLLEVLGADGTLLVFTGWEDRPPYYQHDWDDAVRRAYEDECPPFDPRVALAERDHGRVPEAVRTWPGARHSLHPVCGFAAVGAQAEQLLGGQTLALGFGRGSPLARLVESGGHVLLLGAPLDTITLLHYAEYVAEVTDKRWVHYAMPIRVEGRRVWHSFCELDSKVGAFPYDALDLPDDAFAVIAREALGRGIGQSGQIGAGEAHLFPADRLVDEAILWMEKNFG